MPDVQREREDSEHPVDWRNKVYAESIESDIDALYENNRRALNAIFGLCIAMTLHVIGNYIIVRNLRNRIYHG